MEPGFKLRLLDSRAPTMDFYPNSGSSESDSCPSEDDLCLSS